MKYSSFCNKLLYEHKKIPVIYISGAFTSVDENTLKMITSQASEVSSKLWDAGWSVISVHKNCEGCVLSEHLTYDKWMTALVAQIAKCDALMVLQNWENSEGVKIEIQFAAALNIPVYLYNGRDVPKPKLKV